jgi:hypothetical protein
VPNCANALIVKYGARMTIPDGRRTLRHIRHQGRLLGKRLLRQLTMRRGAVGAWLASTTAGCDNLMAEAVIRS